jgi:hypothetical protein
MIHPTLIDGLLLIGAVSAVPIERGIQHLRARWAGSKDIHHELRQLRHRCEQLEAREKAREPEKPKPVEEKPQAAAEKDNPKDKGKDKEPEKPSTPAKAEAGKGGAGGEPPKRTFPPSGGDGEHEPEPAPAPQPTYDPGYSRQMPFFMTMIDSGLSVKSKQADWIGGDAEIFQMMGVTPGDRWNAWQIGSPATDYMEIHYHDDGLFGVEARCTKCGWHTMQFEQDQAEIALVKHLLKHWRGILAEHFGRPFSFSGESD